MIRTLLTTTALALLLTGGAMAQSESGEASASTETSASASASAGNYFSASAEDVLTSNITGKTVYNGTGQDAEEIGEIGDIVMNPEGKAVAVLVNVGGFLGIGEKAVAVDFSRLQMRTQENGEVRLSLNATSDELENAPAFDRSSVTGSGSMMFGADADTDGSKSGDASASGSMEGDASASGEASGDAAEGDASASGDASGDAGMSTEGDDTGASVEGETSMETDADANAGSDDSK